MNKIDFSIVCPVYNSKLFLHDCILSVLGQSHNSYELILIDDGSNDGSEEICDYYSCLDKRIKVFHKQNRGPMEARMDGIKKAQGEYILFLDSDDMFLTNALKDLHTICTEGYDLIHFQYSKNIDLDKNKIVAELKEINLKDYRKQALLNKRTSMWTKCLKTSIAKKVFVEEDILEKKFGEDFAHTLVIADFVRTICYINKPLYFYRQNEFSITNKINFINFKNEFAFSVFRLQFYYLKKWNIDEMFEKDICCYWLHFCYFYICRAFKSKISTKKIINSTFFKEYQDKFFSYLPFLKNNKKEYFVLRFYFKKHYFSLLLLRKLMSNKL